MGPRSQRLSQRTQEVRMVPFTAPQPDACPSSNTRSDLMGRAVSVAEIRADHPGPAFKILDLLLEMLNAEIWGCSQSPASKLTED